MSLRILLCFTFLFRLTTLLSQIYFILFLLTRLTLNSDWLAVNVWCMLHVKHRLRLHAPYYELTLETFEECICLNQLFLVIPRNCRIDHRRADCLHQFAQTCLIATEELCHLLTTLPSGQTPQNLCRLCVCSIRSTKLYTTLHAFGSHSFQRTYLIQELLVILRCPVDDAVDIETILLGIVSMQPIRNIPKRRCPSKFLFMVSTTSALRFSSYPLIMPTFLLLYRFRDFPELLRLHRFLCHKSLQFLTQIPRPNLCILRSH